MSSGWYRKDSSVFHPEIWPDVGASLQDIREYYLGPGYDKATLDVNSESWYIACPSVEQKIGLCDICCHVDWSSLLRNPSLNRNRGPILILRNMIATREECNFCGLAIKALCTARGQNLEVSDLEEEDVAIGCWIRCEGVDPFGHYRYFEGGSAQGLVEYWAMGDSFITSGAIVLVGDYQDWGQTWIY